MTIRTRLSLWFTILLVVGLALITGWTYYEMTVEHPRVAELLIAEGDGPKEEIGEILLYGGLPALVIVIVGGWFVMRHVLAPLSALTRSVERVRAENLHQQIPTTGSRDELDRLTGVFNDMTHRLDDSFQRIREFTLRASHELKTPLTVMRNELDTALHDDQISTAERERCARQLEEIERLTQIVDGLNFITKADAGLLTLKMDAVSLDELVREACDDAQVLARTGNIEVHLDGCEGLVVTGDRRRLRQLLLILTDNAIKYNRPDGRVAVSLGERGGRAQLTVANTGPGIPPELLNRVFDRFFRGDASHNSEVEGCGLGLPIAQGIVRAHAGEISLASVPNGLTTVTVLLPLAASAALLPATVPRAFERAPALAPAAN